MKRIILTLTGVLIALVIPASATADGPVTRPGRDAPEIIATAGTYSQEQADANRATYLALQDYVDQREQLDRSALDSDRHVILSLVDQLAQRDVDAAAALNVKQSKIVNLRQRVFTLRDRVAARDAKVQDLRAIIRELRGS